LGFIELKLQIVDQENELFVGGETHFHMNDNVNMQNVGLGPKKSSRNISASSLTESKGMACRFQFFFNYWSLFIRKRKWVISCFGD